MADQPEKKVKRRIPFHLGHVGDGTPVKDTRSQKGRKKPPRATKQISRPAKQPSQLKKKGTVGRPRFAYTKELQAKVRDAMALGMTEEQTAAYAGIAFGTWAKHREKIITQTRGGLAENEFKVRKSLFAQAIGGSLPHIVFSAKWLFNYVEAKRTELTGAGGGPVETHAVQQWSDDEIVARLTTMVDNAESRRSTKPSG